jgi:hypothetical protein
MNATVIVDWITIAGSSLFACIPLGDKRIRMRWAKLAFPICAIFGIAKGAINLAWDLRWFSLKDEAGRLLNAYLYMVGGVCLGFIFSLILSGQLTGAKRVAATQPPNTNLDSN